MILDKKEFLKAGSTVALISIISPSMVGHQDHLRTRRSLEEMYELCRTLGLKVIFETIQNKKEIAAGSILGKGKLEEIAIEAKEREVQYLIFDFELTAGQVKNIEQLTNFPIIDRVSVILEIFAKHAQTNASKIQIEIARLQYMLPRLSGHWSHLSRQRGGVGVRGGEGEQQIELDRRMIRDRISKLKEELAVIQISRNEQSKRRKDDIIKAALVGHTNAGKSSLMNRLCQETVLEEDKLFATLDSTYRLLSPNTHPPMVLIDTVGFLGNLPNILLDGFKTTLESIHEADLLLIVVDLSHENYKGQLEVTLKVLEDLKLQDKEKFFIFNKVDLIPEQDLRIHIQRKNYPYSFFVSTFIAEDMKNLKQKILEFFLSQQEVIDLFIPFENGKDHAKILSQTNITHSHCLEKGIYYKLRVPQGQLEKLQLHPYRLSSEEMIKIMSLLS
jgi:GTP-binding protein HflX